MFVVSPLLHSENLEDQKVGLSLAERVAERWPHCKMMEGLVRYSKAHLEVVVRFGRFPHRNGAKGRETLPDEQLWLDSADCPGWAKSQPAPNSERAPDSVRHIVTMKIKVGVTKGEIDNLFCELEGLVAKIPGLIQFEGGHYQSPEGLNLGFSHGFVMTFLDEASRDAYLPHPEHERVRDILLPLVDEALAFDFLVPSIF